MLGVKKALLIVSVFAFMLMGQINQAQASWSLSVGLGEHQRHHERTCHVLPHGHHTLIALGGHRYYYSDGVYYRGYPGNYEIISAPIGVVVSSIPWGYHQRWIHGKIYYEYNDTYYVPILGGYQVVQPPIIEQTTTMIAPQRQANFIVADINEDLTINIPNLQGGYTPVILKRSGNGFIGPQGEFYSEFPRVSQLKVMYGK